MKKITTPLNSKRKRWKDFFLKNGHQIFDSEQKSKEEQGKIEKLEQLLGKKNVEK